jgi:NDP-hexose C3-ketoreductase / dTDP-4-oxo-2-deoxy-alpha-D-pentos-2-ene 2,3-reductase
MGGMSMEYCQLGRSGLSVSRVCLGTLNFGFKTSEPASYATMDRAHEVGINFFDTSNVYGWQEGKDWSENVIGRWFAQGGGRRERTVLATKVYQPLSDWPNDGGLSARHIRRACEDSLRRLQTDYIDLYQMHHVDRNTPWEEIWAAMELLRLQGKILYAGSSNFAGWHLAQAQEAAEARHLLGLVSEQSIYNLARRDIEMEVLPAARQYGIGVLAWSPLYRGLLTGVLAQERMASRYTPEHLEKHRAQLERFEALCDKLGEPPAEVALAWLLTRPGLTAPVTGPRNPAELDSAARAVELQLPGDVLTQLDEIFPGPKTAPEQYAW